MLDKWSGGTAQRYARFVALANRSERHFRRFRSQRDYREVVENVTTDDGRILYESIVSTPFAALALESEYADTVGRPKTIEIAGRRISPTTIRYASTLADIVAEFPQFQSFKRVCEIGIGYGGLARLVCLHHRLTGGQIESYRLLDLPEVLTLTRRYLEHHHLDPAIEYRTKSEIGLKNTDTYDFVISNWAFSEFDRSLQTEYLDKVISRAEAGYMIMNTGLDGRHKGLGGQTCLSDAEIMGKLPSARILDRENAKPKGYVIAFG